MVGISPNIQSRPIRARLMSLSPKTQKFENTNVIVDLESAMEAKSKPAEIVCSTGNTQVVLLTVTEMPPGRIALLNTHTYSQADFDAVGEVLLCPRPLGLLAMQGQPLSTLRAVFGNRVVTDSDAMSPPEIWMPAFDAPSCVTFHPFSPSAAGSCVVQNFNDKAVNVTITIRIRQGKSSQFIDAFTARPIPTRATESKDRMALDLTIPARGRVWVRCTNSSLYRSRRP